ncbi:ATP-binding protein, partial [Klebsiella pneumoniae]
WLRVCELLDNEIRAGKVLISSHFPPDLPALPAPPLWVEQILHNIVSNAIQAQSTNVPGSAWIHLQAERVNNGIALTLTDGGPGLTSEALEQVFIPFYTTRTDGVGLGMALADTLVQRLNGTIEASNITGQGACFRLWFPLRN